MNFDKKHLCPICINLQNSVFCKVSIVAKLKSELTHKTVFLFNAENDARNLNFKFWVYCYCLFDAIPL